MRQIIVRKICEISEDMLAVLWHFISIYIQCIKYRGLRQKTCYHCYVKWL